MPTLGSDTDFYSKTMTDSEFEYRYATIKTGLGLSAEKSRLPSLRTLTENFTKILSEEEWRTVFTQGLGWSHYGYFTEPEMIHFLFRRPIGTDGKTGAVNPVLREQALKKVTESSGIEFLDEEKEESEKGK